MSIFLHLSVLALRPLLGVAANTVGLGVSSGAANKAADKIGSWLVERFTDHGSKITVALHRANDQAWCTLEMALGGDGLFDRLGRLFHRADQKALADEVRRFLRESTLSPGAGAGLEFSQRCLSELQTARKAGLLSADAVDGNTLAQTASALARYSRPEESLECEMAALGGIASALPAEGYGNLRTLLMLKPADGASPLLAEAARYFFRRQVETDGELFRGLAFSQAQAMAVAQTHGFERVETALDQWGGQLQQAINGFLSTLTEVHANVLDLQVAMQQASAQGVASHDLLKEIHYRLQRLGMSQGELCPQHSFSIRTDAEKQAVKSLLERFRQLPADQQERLPAALNGIGKLLVGAGDFQEARKAFDEVAGEVDAGSSAAAEAHYNACRAALEQRRWDEALIPLEKAIQLDPSRFSPFPTEKYQIRRILGAGGFGIAFLCHDTYMDEAAVIKSLYADDLERNIDDIFREVKLLRRLRHQHIVNVTACDFAAPGKTRPYFVMDYFEGDSLQEWLEKNGKLELKDLLAIAIPTAEALQAAHVQGVFHRDIKPDNLLVAPAGGQWQVKLIDFGLALRQQTMRNSMTGGGLGQSVQGSSVAGTIEYAPPEQLGRMNIKPGPYSDIYSFAKLCCKAMFGKSDARKDLRKLPSALGDLFESCMDPEPADRPQRFDEVIAVLREAEKSLNRPSETAEQHQSGLARELAAAAEQQRREEQGRHRVAQEQRQREEAERAAVVEQQRREEQERRRLAEEQRQREEAERAAAAERKRKARIAELLATARGNDSWEKSKVAMAALAELLQLDPQHAEALALRKKIRAYSGPGKIGDSWTNTLDMKFAYIPAGNFEMGSPAHEAGRADNETLHHVKVTKPFMLATTAVTQAQWEAVMGENPSHFEGDDLPVEMVRWDDAVLFCKKISEKEGQKYRLPTEAEWEYACRSGTKTAYYTGDGDAALREAGWYGGNSEKKTHPVRQKKPNAWGLYDMHGNVWQWCSDWYDNYPTGKVSDPTGPTHGSSRVLRGGSWFNNPALCRTAYRHWYTPDNRYNIVGLRLCLDF